MRTLILGMGNTILSDDAVGIITLRYLQSNFKYPPDINFEETSWGGFRIIDLLRGYDYAIILDSIRTGKSEQGHIHHLKVEDFMHTLRLNSFHDINFYTALKLAESLKEKMPRDTDIFAMEIQNNCTISESLSPVIRDSVNKLSELVHETLISRKIISEDFYTDIFKRKLSDDELHDLYIEQEIKDEAGG